MKIGIVLLNYKDYKTTEEAVKIAYKLPIDYIAVVDNASPNESANQLAKLHHPKLTFIASQKNGGYAAGNNIGIRYLLNNTDCDVIGIVNPDVILNEEFVVKIKDDFIHTDFSLLTGVQYKPDKCISSRAFWPLLSKMDVMRPNLLVLNHFFEPDNLSYIQEKISSNDSIVEVGTVEGCCFFIRSQDMENVGLLDESTFLFFEEDILCRKLIHMGKKIGVDRRISFLHNHSKTIRSVYSQYQMDKLLFHSRGIFFRRHMSENLWDKFLYSLSEVIFYVERPFWYWYMKMKCLLDF